MNKFQKVRMWVNFHRLQIQSAISVFLCLVVITLTVVGIHVKNTTEENYNAKIKYLNTKYKNLEIASDEIYQELKSVEKARDTLTNNLAKERKYGELKSKMRWIGQNPTYPTGCEMVSTAILLSGLVENITPEDLLPHLTTAEPRYIDGKLYIMNPHIAFNGSIYSTSGLGTYPKNIMNMANNYLTLTDIGKEWLVEDISGIDDVLFFEFLDKGIPLQVWVTINMIPVEVLRNFNLLDESGNPTEETFAWINGEHSIVVIGYDANYIYTYDPLKEGITSYNRDNFMNIWHDMGRYAVFLNHTTEFEKSIIQE